ncbi:MAG TPA: EamA family transporter, partial [Spirochaetia bacterium]|nr:EamA family transporter [Spirochaetia bacterium]
MNRRLMLIIGCYALVYLAWGGTYFFIRESVATIPPFYVVGVRWSVGGLLLLAIAGATGRLRHLPPGRDILSALL